MKDYTRQSLSQVLDGHSLYSFSGFVATNTLLANLEFSRDAHTPSTEDGFLLHTRGATAQDQPQRSPLHGHPIACRSFATFAPASSAQLSTLSGVPLIRNPTGVTVWDVYTTVQSRLDATDSVYRMNEYLRFVDYRKALSNRVDDITHLLNKLTTLRDFFYVFRWDGLYYAGQDSNSVPRFAFGFQTVRRVIKGVSEPQLIV